jgi:riboflavin kinase/FMN adenylyltransferase
MKVIYGKSELEKEKINACAVTVGTFDGVHRGHMALLDRLSKAAHERNLNAVVVTFDPHPQMVLGAKGRTEILNTTEEQLELLSKLDIDLAVVLEFNQQLASLEANKFIEWMLVDHLKMKHFVIGYDHSFGKLRQGNYELASSLSQVYSYTLEMVGPIYDDGNPIKSTAIRQELKNGDYDRASKMLGYRYFLTGTVVKGHGIGRKLGYPTINLDLPSGKLLPKEGVYAANATIKKESFPGMAYIGGRLTYGDETICVEVNLFGFDKEIIGAKTRLTLEQYTRPPVRFDSEKRLIQALADDKNEIKRILNI